jgi:hypothetical protein
LQFLKYKRILPTEFVMYVDDLPAYLRFISYHYQTEISVYTSHSYHEFFFSLCIQTGSGAQPMGTRSLSPGVMQPGYEANHSPPSRAKVKKKVELYLHYSIRLHDVVLNKYQGQLYLYLYYHCHAVNIIYNYTNPCTATILCCQLQGIKMNEDKHDTSLIKTH